MAWKPSKQSVWGFIAGIIVAVFLFWLGLNLHKTYRAVWENREALKDHRAALIRTIERVKTLESNNIP